MRATAAVLRSKVCTFTGLALLAGCGPSLRHVTPASPVAGSTVYVREFRVTYEPLATDHSVPADGAAVTQAVLRSLRTAGVNAELASAAGFGTGLTVEGQVTEIDGGSRAARYFGGFYSGGHAGAARVAITGRAVRADGTVIGEFSAKRHAGIGLFGGNTETLLNDCIEAIASDVSNMVVTGQYSNEIDGEATSGAALVHP